LIDINDARLCSMNGSQRLAEKPSCGVRIPLGTEQEVVRPQLHVRKFFCTVAGCKRHIFTERLCGVAPWARRTQRLGEQLTAIGLALGGAGAARLSHCLGLSVSHDTLLRLVRRVPLPIVPMPSVLGVDDWAHRKGKPYIPLFSVLISSQLFC
jgi:transposase